MKEIKKLMAEENYEEALKKLLIIEQQYLLKIQCLYELQKYQELTSFFEQISREIEDDYFEILGFYILSLIELNEYDKALNSLNDELSMPYIQDDYEEVLNNLYDDVIAQKQAFLVEAGIYNIQLSEEELSNILENETNYDELLEVIMKLEDYNIRKVLPSVEIFLQANQAPTLKTFILELLIKQQISEVVLVVKDSLEFEFMPVANQFVYQDLNYIRTHQMLTDRLDKIPSYLEMCLDILDMFAYIIYPNVIDIDEVNFHAALIEYYIFSLNSDDLSEDFAEYYQIDTTVVIDNIDYLIKYLEAEEKFQL